MHAFALLRSSPVFSRQCPRSRLAWTVANNDRIKQTTANARDRVPRNSTSA